MTRLDRTHAMHHVYRCFDESGRLIYVGSSANLFGRLAQHRRTSWWAGQVVNVTAKVYPSGILARVAEREAIANEAPRWNKAGRWVTRHGWTQEQWDDWLTMLLERLGQGGHPGELRRFAGLYLRRWGVEPDPIQVMAIEAAEAEFEARRVESHLRLAEGRARSEAIQREDELALRRDRKAAKAKAKRLAKKARQAEQIVREFDEAIQP